ncbi:MAG: hypothetical protein NWE92_03630 [Candidatus Bathyarchaeota archaeon]|nr:hypothetical protein [Candidatus Bathyarchaeota archaeon]
MAVFLVSTYIIKPEKLLQHQAWGKNLVASMKKHPELFREVSSLRVFRQKSDGGARRFIALWEFKTVADKKSWEHRLQKDKELMGFSSEFGSLILPNSFSRNTWKPVKSMRRVHA